MGVGNFLRDLTSIKSRISGFYRPNRFFMMLLTPAASGIIPIPLPIDPMIIKASNMPGRQVGEIKLRSAGINYSMPTSHTYSDLVVTITTWHFGDYRMIHNWFNSIQNKDNELFNASKFKNVDDFKVTATIGATGDSGLTSMLPLHNMMLHGVYPKDIGDIQFSQDPTDEFISFEVTFNVDYITML